ncbi:putative leader peptide [Saccharopolyspora sp. ID03-671]
MFIRNAFSWRLHVDLRRQASSICPIA